MNKLTLENYYDPKAKHLTRSKIMVYLQSPALFYKYFVLGEKPIKEKSDAFKVGGAVDSLLAQIDNLDNYAVFEGDARTKDGKFEKQLLIDAGKEVLSKTQYSEVVSLADAITKTSAWQVIKDWKRQEVLVKNIKIGKHFTSIAGLPDFINFDEATGILDIVDLKTQRKCNPRQYFYHCQEYGYLMQAALYCSLAAHKHKKAKEIRFWHLIVEKTEANNVLMFRFPQRIIDEETAKLEKIIDTIANDKEFKKQDATFEDAIKLTNPNLSFEDIVEEEEGE
jgi:hypothetical protein